MKEETMGILASNLNWACFHLTFILKRPQEAPWPWEHIPLNAPLQTRTHAHTDKCTQTHSTKNGVHLYAVADVVGHSDQQGLLDDRIQQGQEDLCSYLQQRRGRLSLV